MKNAEEIAELVLCAARNSKPKEWTTWDSFAGRQVTNRESNARAENRAAAEIIEKLWPKDRTGRLMPTAEPLTIAGEILSSGFECATCKELSFKLLRTEQALQAANEILHENGLLGVITDLINP